MSKDDDEVTVQEQPEYAGGYEVPAAGSDPDSRLRMLKHARAAAEGDPNADVADFDDEITDERNRAGRGPQQDEEAREEMERVREERAKAAERAGAAERRTAAASTSETSQTAVPQGRSATPPARSTTTTTKSTTDVAKDKGK
jgi:hypothetical protein